MQIWVDADACPGAVKEILYRAADRTEVMLVLVANQPLRVPKSRFIRTVQVAAGFDVADGHIATEVEPDDLVVTADIPLAAAIVERGALALNPRGELYTAENVRERLNLRDMREELRDAGARTGGPAALGKRDRQSFANQLDRLLARRTSG